MILTCRNCGGTVEWKAGDTVGVCRDCGAKQAIEKSDIYEEAKRLGQADTEESLEQAMALYKAISGWQDADRQYLDCRTRLGKMRWKAESAWLKEEEDRFEAKVSRWKKIAITLLVLILVSITAVTTVSMIRYKRYTKAAEYFTAGEYERAAAAFQAMGDYQDARARVFVSAVELYNAGRFEEALPYLVWLDGYIDNGYYLGRCQERLAAQGK